MESMDVDTMAAALAACGMAMAAAQLAVQARATRKAWLRRLAKAKAALEEAEQAETIEEDMDPAEIAAPIAEDNVDLKEQEQEQEHVQEKEEVEATEAVRDDEETSTADITSEKATTSSAPVPPAEDDSNLHLTEETAPASEPLATAVSKALENESQEKVDENNEQEAETRVEAENPHTPEQQAPRRGRRSTRSSTATSGVSSKKRSTMTARKTRSTRSSDTADKENETDPRQQLLSEENKDEEGNSHEDSLGDLVMMDKVKRTAQRSSKKMSFDADTVSEASMSSRRSARARRAPKIFEPEW
ncbi:Hypothetical Protein FCC1311_106472 [Hondaea fermentalgiana]|uniref:Uncharacterized protein n=1 Tax=Hondaea fermentalgiana TaxID=2315210 RepID=A0A2R5H050_9STRA|nr:Hypothetical Protein FCC1311_106472 [Hondaea fermentalgiana]|eukprot:GBG34423.1 Hypothetical Protein FCC1311_106472 [Hondaea fermentalgiana]